MPSRLPPFMPPCSDSLGDRSCRRYDPRNEHCFLNCPKGSRSRNPCGANHLRAIALRLPLLLRVNVKLAKLMVRRYTQ